MAYKLIEKNDLPHIDWWEEEIKYEKENPSALSRSVVMPRNEAAENPPRFNTEADDYDELLSGKSKFDEQRKWDKYVDREPDKSQKTIMRLSDRAERRSQKMVDWRNESLSYAWFNLPEGSPIREMGRGLFAIFFKFIDPVAMSVTDHENDIVHSIVMYETVFKQLTGYYEKNPDELKNYDSENCVEYWFEKQRRWAMNQTDSKYLERWDQDVKECQKRIKRNYVNRLENDNLPLYVGVISGAFGGVDAAWDGNGVYGVVTKRDIRNWLENDGTEIKDETFKTACEVAEKLVYIGESYSRGKDKPSTVRNIATK